MKNNAKKAKSAASVPITAAQQQSSIDNNGIYHFIFIIYFVYSLICILTSF
jgi:hypothetical protein